MNEKQPYEKHLADKMQQLPPPGDANRSWGQMRSLLDMELPEGGSRNGRNGNTKWWMIGLLVGIIMIGTWLSVKQSGSSVKDVAATTTAQSSEKETTPSSGVSLPDSPEKEKSNSSGTAVNNPSSTTESAKENKTDNDINAKTKIDASNETSIVKTNAKSKEEITKNENKSTKKADLNSRVEPIKKDLTSNSNFDKKADDQTEGVKDNISPAKNGTSSGTEKTTKDLPNAGIDKKDEGSNAAAVKLNDKSKGKATGLSANNSEKDPPVSELFLASEENTAKASDLKIGIEKVAGDRDEVDVLIRDSMEDLSIQSVVPKALAKPGRRYNRETKTFEPRSSRPKVVGTGDNKNIAIGFSLPLGFPLGDQRAVAYNFNAGQNTVSDYLPAPHFQYHMNDKSFIQSEFQFISPQFIQPVLLSQQRLEIGSMQTKYTSIYAKKLYYFNMPMTAHYSPFKHFYLGTGLQFSSLLSGVAMNEQKLYTTTGPNTRDSSFNINYLKFRNDTLSGKFNGSEFRVLFDANYYWQKFTVGLRYNQALTNYISIRATSTSGLFQDRNRALQFYLRYNFWEDKKKKKGNLLTFK